MLVWKVVQLSLRGNLWDEDGGRVSKCECNSLNLTGSCILIFNVFFSEIKMNFMATSIPFKSNKQKHIFSFSSTLHLLNLLSYIVHHKHYRVIKWFYFYSPGLINKICFQRKNTRNYKNKTHFPSSSSGKQSQI